MNKVSKIMAAVSLVLACSSSAYCDTCADASIPSTTFYFVNNTAKNIKLKVLPSNATIGKVDMLMGPDAEKTVSPGKTLKRTVYNCAYTGKTITPKELEAKRKAENGPPLDKLHKKLGKVERNLSVNTVKVIGATAKSGITGTVGLKDSITSADIPLNTVVKQPSSKTITFDVGGKVSVTDGAPPEADVKAAK